ncbi:unnamed protein product [Prorocentrum cordatum]|uniref:Uncharacterized protein n=1 Tax=Prorocentrum cordatum TaxID=2364126 RepID=A0ABN9S921_9DINO|nr:unnamed protein product [Polarella glacialis]
MRGLVRCALLVAARAALGIQILEAKTGHQQRQSLRASADALSAASAAAENDVAADESSAQQSSSSALLDEISAQQSSALLDEISAQQSSALLDEISAQQSPALLDEISAQQSPALVDEINAQQSPAALIEISAQHSSDLGAERVNGEDLIAQLSGETRERLRRLTGANNDKDLAAEVLPAPVEGRLVLVAPPHLRRQQRAASLLGLGAARAEAAAQAAAAASGSGAGVSEFAPSAEFQAAEASSERGQVDSAAEAVAGVAAGLPWGVGSPRTGDSLPVYHYSAMPMIDGPKEWEYSLESGDNIQSFSSAQQDVKLLTQVFENVTNGFYVDSNAGDGEIDSNTLLLELAGWRGLIMEPRPYYYMNLWSKWRKAWLFLGCLSPHENSTKIGFDTDGNIDMLSGHKIHAHPMKAFMAEMGGRKTIDFWNLRSGNYEAEILNETLLGSGGFLEFGVVLVRFDGRRAGRGTEPYVQMRSRDATEELIFEICNNASLRHIGGLDPYWINHVEPRYGFRDEVWVNPRYFETRGIPTPAAIKSAPPPPLADYSPHPAAGTGDFPWDRGYSRVEEIGRVKLYFNKSKSEAALMEPVPKAHRVGATKLVY